MGCVGVLQGFFVHFMVWGKGKEPWGLNYGRVQGAESQPGCKAS